MLVLNLWFLHINLPSADIIGKHHHIWFEK
jgi:hypothetical protein